MAEPPVSQERKDALLKLIQVEPDDLSGLVRATGWGEDQTRMALLQLTVDGLVRRQYRSGRLFYCVRPATITTTQGKSS